MADKKLIIPRQDSGYYRFGDIADLITSARFPIESCPQEAIKRVIVWRENGESCGVYGAYDPPEEKTYTEIKEHERWRFTPISANDIGRKTLDRWRQDALAASEHEWPRWDNGDLIVTIERSQDTIFWEYTRREFYQRINDELKASAVLDRKDDRHLPVVDHLQLPLRHPTTRALRDGGVSFDAVKAWGRKVLELDIDTEHTPPPTSPTDARPVASITAAPDTSQSQTSMKEIGRSSRQRWHPLTSVIDEAIETAQQPRRIHDIWRVLTDWALEESHGFLGVVDGKLKYTKNGKDAWYTLDALRSDLWRRSKKAHAPSTSS